MFCDLKTLSMEELVGRLRVAEDRFEPSVEEVTNKAGQLMMTEDDWVAKHKSRVMTESSTSSGGKSGGNSHYSKKGKNGARGGGGGNRDPRDSGGKEHTSMGTPRRKGRCNKCKVYGHWARECKKVKEPAEAAHHANVDADPQPALLVAQVCNLVRTTGVATPQVFLNQERVIPSKYEEGSWVLDTELLTT